MGQFGINKTLYIVCIQVSCSC